jgi:polysaccharide biosynthesis transport protein
VREETHTELVPSPRVPIEEVRAVPAAIRKANEIQDVPGLLEFWRVLQKRRATIFTVLFIVFTATVVATLKEKPVYRARALVEIQKENPDIPTLQELFQVENISDSYLETQYRILKSESLARSVISQTHLDRSPDFASETRASLFSPRVNAAAQPVVIAGIARNDPWVHDKILKKFQDHLDIEPLKRSRLIEISFESTDRQLAAQVVNALTSDYIEQNLQSRWDASQNATEWLSRQLLDAQAKVEKSQDALQKYARENGLLFLDNDKGSTENIVAQRLRELQDALTKAQAERFEKESVYHLLEDGDYGSIPEVFGNKLMQDLTEKLAELERDRSKLTTIFNPDYPRLKEIQNQIDDLQGVLTAERDRAAQGLTNAYRAAVEREQMLRDAFKEQQAEANLIAEKSVQYNILKREADTTERLYTGLLEKMKETGVSASLKAPNVRVVDAAFPPLKPDRPKILLNLMMGLVLGLCLGTGAAFLQEHLDNTLKTPEDSERFLQLPTLAFVPIVRPAHNHGAMHLIYERARVLTGKTNGNNHGSAAISPWSHTEANGHTLALAEAFHGLRTSVLFSIAKRPPVSLLVTSTQSGEGKTTVAANLAVSLAQLGDPVLLIDADLRRPSVHQFFGLTNSAGLVNYLAGHSDWRSLVRNTEPPGLSALLSGPAPPNPVNLLSSEFMRTLLREASQQYKYAILDSPPLLNLADSRILSTLVDGLILVVAAGITPRDVIHRACASALDAGSQVLGVAMNYANASADRYGYGYSPESFGESS